jgi:hypothetical protein
VGELNGPNPARAHEPGIKRGPKPASQVSDPFAETVGDCAKAEATPSHRCLLKSEPAISGKVLEL